MTKKCNLLRNHITNDRRVCVYFYSQVRMQAKEHLGRYSSPADCLKKTLRSEGIASFYTGLGPTLWRNCVWNTGHDFNDRCVGMIFFEDISMLILTYLFFYHIITVYFATMHGIKSNLLPVARNKTESLIQTLFSGFGAAVFATCFNAPFDVVKSRFQSQLPALEGIVYFFSIFAAGVLLFGSIRCLSILLIALFAYSNYSAHEYFLYKIRYLLHHMSISSILHIYFNFLIFSLALIYIYYI